MTTEHPQMKASTYTAYEMMQSILGAMEPDVVQANTTEYIELLNSIRKKVSEEHSGTLNGILTNPNAHNILVPIILSYVTDYVNATNDASINITRTAERIYQDMAGFGILSPYLNDPTVEEININAWNAIEILWSDRAVLLEETFSSPQDCVDMIRKMVRIGGVHIDYSQPIIDSFIGDGTRISATLPPVNSEATGATASIRKQTFKNVTLESYVQKGFATQHILDFVDIAMKHNISVGLAGSPGAGKTTFMTCLLKSFLHSKTSGNNRICSIEEAREIELGELEEKNPGGGERRMISRTLQFNTTQGENPVTARRLIRHALRVNPQIIVPAEMRGEEAIEAVEAGLTGVQIVSSFHAWGAKDGYMRILSMCQMGNNNTSESSLLQMIIRAFPLMIFIKKDDDGVRRIHEVFEATGVEDGQVVGNTLFRFIRTRVEENEEGRIINIEGEFVQTASISASMRRVLIQNGAKREFVDRYYFEGENPHHPERFEDSQVEVVTVHDSSEDVLVRPDPAAAVSPTMPVAAEPVLTRTDVFEPNATRPIAEVSYPGAMDPSVRDIAPRDAPRETVAPTPIIETAPFQKEEPVRSEMVFKPVMDEEPYDRPIITPANELQEGHDPVPDDVDNLSNTDSSTANDMVSEQNAAPLFSLDRKMPTRGFWSGVRKRREN